MADLVFNASLPIVNPDGTPTQTMRVWMTLVSKLNPITGTGAPENSVEAAKGRFYWDETGNRLYFKESADIAKDPKRGWVIV